MINARVNKQSQLVANGSHIISDLGNGLCGWKMSLVGRVEI